MQLASRSGYYYFFNGFPPFTPWSFFCLEGIFNSEVTSCCKGTGSLSEIIFLYLLGAGFHHRSMECWHTLLKIPPFLICFDYLYDNRKKKNIGQMWIFLFLFFNFSWEGRVRFWSKVYFCKCRKCWSSSSFRLGRRPVLVIYSKCQNLSCIPLPPPLFFFL